MREPVTFKTKLEVTIWEMKRRNRIKPEAEATYVKLGGELFELKGCFAQSTTNLELANLVHLFTKRHFTCHYDKLLRAIRVGYVRKLGEMEVMAWAAI